MSGDTYRSENVIFTDLRFPEKAEGAFRLLPLGKAPDFRALPT